MTYSEWRLTADFKRITCWAAVREEERAKIEEFMKVAFEAGRLSPPDKPLNQACLEELLDEIKARYDAKQIPVNSPTTVLWSSEDVIRACRAKGHAACYVNQGFKIEGVEWMTWSRTMAWLGVKV